MSDNLIEATKAFIVISGFEWGPGLSKAIISLSRPADAVNKNGSSIITGKKERKITDIYLSDEKGNHVSGSSKYVSLELNILFDSEVSPFYYNETTYQNEWISEYIINTTFQVTVDGKENKISLNQNSINNRILPDTAPFTNRGHFSGKYKNPMTNEEELLTLQYGAYEPSQIREDNAKNPLIIWLNGQGEGGTDIDICMLGNQVTSLAKPKIQSYFTTQNGEKGAYVLAIQTSTYWMDGGDGKNNLGDIPSRYTEILMDTIKHYLTINTDVDTNRIYLGGCSNGAFMSMTMLLTYPNYFAASYQTCEPYPFMVIKRDEKGEYISAGFNLPVFPTNVVNTEERFMTPEKIQILKDIPMWFEQSEDDPLVIGWRYGFPTYKELLKAGAKNCWFSYFQTVESVTLPGTKFFGHWSWVRLFNDQITKVQDREKILNSTDTKNYGFVATNDGGGTKEASDEKGTYKSIFAWLNSQIKKQ